MKLKDLLKEREELRKITTLYTEKLEEADEFLDKFLKKNKIYAPIEILKNYNDKEISKITLINDKKEEWTYTGGEIMEIRNGHFYYSDYESGIVQYDSADNHYHHHFHWHDSDLGVIVGVRNVFLNEDTIVKETSEEELLKDYLDKTIKIDKKKTEKGNYYE